MAGDGDGDGDGDGQGRRAERCGWALGQDRRSYSSPLFMMKTRVEAVSWVTFHRAIPSIWPSIAADFRWLISLLSAAERGK